MKFPQSQIETCCDARLIDSHKTLAAGHLEVVFTPRPVIFSVP